MFSQMRKLEISRSLSMIERVFISTTANHLRKRLFERLKNLSVLDTLDFSDQMCDQLYELSDGEFEEFCTILSQCDSLGSVFLSANRHYMHCDRFVMLLNTLAELKNTEISLFFKLEHLEEPRPEILEGRSTISPQELGEALSQLPIKRLHVEPASLINPTFWKYIARCPIESLSLKYSPIAPAPNRFAFLENFLAQHDRVFRGQPRTVRSVRIICDMTSQPEMEALSSALNNQGQNLKRLYLAASGNHFTTYADNNFFNSLSTLQSLREINLDWNGMFMGSFTDNPHLFFTALEQCPALHTLHLMNLYKRNAKNFRIHDPISKNSFNLLCNGLKKLEALTTLKIDQTAGLEKKTPPELAVKFLNLEQVLHAVGLSEPIEGNLTIRTHLLNSMFGDGYLEYSREYGRDAMFNTQYAALKAIVEENRMRIEAQQHRVQSPLTFSYSNNTETPASENKPSKMHLKPSGT